MSTPARVAEGRGISLSAHGDPQPCTLRCIEHALLGTERATALGRGLLHLGGRARVFQWAQRGDSKVPAADEVRLASRLEVRAAHVAEAGHAAIHARVGLHLRRIGHVLRRAGKVSSGVQARGTVGGEEEEAHLHAVDEEVGVRASPAQGPELHARDEEGQVVDLDLGILGRGGK